MYEIERKYCVNFRKEGLYGYEKLGRLNEYLLKNTFNLGVDSLQYFEGTDRYYVHPEIDTVIRLRSTGHGLGNDRLELTIKKNVGEGIQTRQEFNLAIDKFSDGVEWLGALGFKLKYTVVSYGLYINAKEAEISCYNIEWRNGDQLFMDTFLEVELDYLYKADEDFKFWEDLLIKNNDEFEFSGPLNTSIFDILEGK